MDKEKTKKELKKPQKPASANQPTDKAMTKKAREADHNSMEGKTPGTNTRKE
ncbi:hypothetical protein [Solitalea canadensis]|uniref:Uncharacterized protein n=1 Tax=Solitalea canadensis (strain ATCC 29591 / DSM 3403 / JCM 21819 / LMG 8368 / NBRC 15130 / NCIMB 12057 / USAM 9D) TaxID=929556 RepID=H8KQI6_SOLCM|nr:hypothetical protein [Solitalea canadensis]AFD06602.1 hypothetical protein Solca_1529 [Solitalea canadensis DSM 3403]